LDFRYWLRQLHWAGSSWTNIGHPVKTGEKIMKKLASIAIIVLMGLPALAAKQKNTGIIKDLQPTNFAPAKKKHQQYDFSIDTVVNSYQCRTSQDHSTNATNFPVGSSVDFIIDGHDAEIKTPTRKSAKCRITRVQALP